MSCSCPDWAVPCKHIASVIYLLAGEIDKNPFLIFQLHDFDLIEALEDRHMSVQQAVTLKIPAGQDISTGHPIETAALPDDFTSPDYSVLPFLSQKIMALLDSKPLFFDKDFKLILKSVYQHLARSAPNLSFHHTVQETLPEVIAISRVQITLNDSFSLKNVQLSGEDRSVTSSDLGVLLNLLDGVEMKTLPWCYPEMSGMYELKLFTMHCLEKGAIIPQILRTGPDLYRIRWIPALLNEIVKSCFDSLTLLLNHPIVRIESGSGTWLYQDAGEQALTLFSLIVDEIILESDLYEDLKWRHASSKFSHKILELFFDHSAVPFGEFQEKEIPRTIQQWLSRLYITHRTYVPLIQILTDENQFVLDIQIEHRNRSGKPVPLRRFLNHPDYLDSKYEVLRDLALLAEYFPQLKMLIESEGDEKLAFHAHDFTPVLLDILPVIRMFGIRILMPRSLRTLIRPRLSLQLGADRDRISMSSLSLDKVLSFHWKVALGDQLIGFKEFREAVRDSTGLVKIKDQYVLIDQKEIDQILRQLNKPPELGPGELLKTALTGTYQDAHIGLDPAVQLLLDKITAAEAVSFPDEVTDCLRPYQKTGAEWMVKNARLGFGSLLADDMGLGKTIQVLAVLLHFKNQGALEQDKVLVVVPTTLITNWVKEIEMFTPSLRPLVYHGQNRKSGLQDHDLLITSYGILRSELKYFQKQKWHALVLDEAQNIKNPGTAQTRAAKKISARIKIAMSGTPVENRLSEYWSILDFTNQGYLGSLKRFSEEFARPIQLDHNQEKIDHFRRMTAPFILRRVKTDKAIIRDLPEKIENNLFCNLTPDQAALYQSLVNDIMEQIEAFEGIARRGLVFKLMTGLKQICNHPVHYLKSGNTDPSLSGKCSLLWNLLDTIYENNEKVLIFTQYREMGHLLSRFIQEKYGRSPLFLHGGSSRPQRDNMVETFQNQRHARTFILSLKAGGTGLNLTAAQNVIHFDLWWNPAVENQATDRAYRIGQTRNVMVYRLLTEGTFEERINEMLQDKKWLADMTVTSGEKWIGDLSDRELHELIRLD